MLVSFTLSNFRSFSEPETLSLKALPRSSNAESHGSTHRIVTARDGLDLLKCVSIYGANASGKSNLLDGLRRMRAFVRNGRSHFIAGRPLNYDPFAFSQESLAKPTTFEIEVLLDESLYRYGFEFNQDKIVAEWLYQDDALLFERDGSDISVSNDFPEGERLQKKTDESVLFLSVCRFFNGEISKKITRFLTSVVCRWHYSGEFRSTASLLVRDENLRERVVELVRWADTGISDLIVVPDDEVSKIEAIHRCAAPNILPFQEESAGTRKLVQLVIPFIKAMERGSLVVIDELDTNIHPLLLDMLIELFQSHENKTGQLIYTTHNTYPLRNETLQREQVWLVEKRYDMSSTLINLAEYKKHPQESREEDYLNGRYGGIPQLDLLNMRDSVLAEGGVS